MLNFTGYKKDLIIGLIIFAIFLVQLIGTDAGFMSNFIAYICLFLIAGQGWNLLGGYIGEISFGHAMFYGIGAYTVGLPIGYKMDIPLFVLVILGGVISSLFAYIISYPLLRIKGFPFLIGTFGLGIVFERIFVSTPVLFATKGIFVPSINRFFLYGIIVVVAIFTIMFTKWLVTGDIGLRFKAVRDSDIAAEMVGINIFRAKRQALVIGAFYVGIAGALFALYSSFVHPLTAFSTSTSLSFLIGAYIGGIGTVMGPVVGGIIAIVIQEFSRAYIPISGGHHLVLGIMLVVIMLVAREGIYPFISNKLGSYLSKNSFFKKNSKSSKMTN